MKTGELLGTISVVKVFLLSSLLCIYVILRKIEGITYYRVNPSSLENIGGGQKFSLYATSNFASNVAIILVTFGLTIYFLLLSKLKNKIYKKIASTMCVISCILIIVSWNIEHII